jgi:hypothetical protein
LEVESLVNGTPLGYHNPECEVLKARRLPGDEIGKFEGQAVDWERYGWVGKGIAFVRAGEVVDDFVTESWTDEMNYLIVRCSGLR